MERGLDLELELKAHSGLNILSQPEGQQLPKWQGLLCCRCMHKSHCDASPSTLGRFIAYVAAQEPGSINRDWLVSDQHFG
jgi:hypothetical protein